VIYDLAWIPFGALLPIEMVQRGNRKLGCGSYWRCVCTICDTPIITSSRKLREGTRTTCGNPECRRMLHGINQRCSSLVLPTGARPGRSGSNRRAAWGPPPTFFSARDRGEAGNGVFLGSSSPFSLSSHASLPMCLHCVYISFTLLSFWHRLATGSHQRRASLQPIG
jgi:hypothetical protein